MLGLIQRFSKTLTLTPRFYSQNVTAAASSSNVTPINIARTLDGVEDPFRIPRQVWVENIDTTDEQKLELLELNPLVYGTMPRIDIIHQNVVWQRKYRWVSFAHSKTRNEVRGGGRKPFPQKGGGRARHGSIRSPLFRGGGRIHGPRSPTSHFYMLPYFNRVHGLTSTLSVKLAQDDLHVVKDLEIPTNEPKYLEELTKSRLWGPSVLFVDDFDIIPENFALALESVNHMNFLPVYGLNVYSMIKHNTLVLTKSAALKIQEKLIESLNRSDAYDKMQSFKLNQNS